MPLRGVGDGLRWMLAVLLVCQVSLVVADNDPAAEREIQYLISYVADSGAIFIRNGTRHDAREAAEHLALKYRNASRYATSAEDFIDNLASQSSITRKPYSVITADGRELSASDWLHSALAEYRRGNEPAY